MFEVQEIEVTPCNQSEGKLHISLLFEEETHNKENECEITMGKLFALVRGRNAQQLHQVKDLHQLKQLKFSC